MPTIRSPDGLCARLRDRFLRRRAARTGATQSGGPVLWRDLAGVLVVTVCAALLAARFNLNEAFFHWSRAAERFQLDELPMPLLVLAAGLAWFAWRRYREACRELASRRAVEQRIEQLLADNRRLANQGTQAQELERRHLARELHDELGQYLNAITLDAARIRGLAAARDPEIHRLSLGLMHSASHVYKEIGGMIRKLRPIGLDEFGLPSALEHCIEGWRERLPEATFSLAVDGDFDDLADPLNIALYRLVQEGLTNVSKFAQSARVEIFLGRAPWDAPAPDGRRERRDDIVVTMADDGPGADLAAPRNGLGLIGMRERVEALGGEFQLSSEPGRGFQFYARLPAHAKAVEPLK